MKQRPRIHYTESQKALMWERWQKGESLQQIAQLFDRNHSSTQPILAATGGIRPAPRCRSRWALSPAEREEISRAVVAGHSIRGIAAQLGRAPSTISREIKRTYPDDTSRQVSHETIYRSLFIQARGALRKELMAHLRRTRVMRRSRHHTMKTDHHGRITTRLRNTRRTIPPNCCIDRLNPQPRAAARSPRSIRTVGVR
jgi:hypothetical protein